MKERRSSPGDVVVAGCGIGTDQCLTDYTNAFTHYLRTGAVGALSEFYAEDARPCPAPGLSKRIRQSLHRGAPRELTRRSSVSSARSVSRGWLVPMSTCILPARQTSWNMVKTFPRFIENARDTHDLDYLSSFATLDRAWTEVFFARDDSFPDVPASGIPGDAEALMSLCGRLAPWVRQVSLEYRVLDAWSRLRHVKLGQRTAVPRAPQTDPDLAQRGRCTLPRSGASRAHVHLTCRGGGGRAGRRPAPHSKSMRSSISQRLSHHCCTITC